MGSYIALILLLVLGTSSEWRPLFHLLCLAIQLYHTFIFSCSFFYEVISFSDHAVEAIWFVCAAYKYKLVTHVLYVFLIFVNH